MKKFAIALSLVAYTATASFAGGLDAPQGEGTIVPPPATGGVGSGAIVGVVGALALVCLVACGGSDSAGTTEESGS